MFGDALTALQPKRRKQNSTEFRVVWCVTVVRMNVPFVILLSTRFIRCESGSDVISGRKFPHTEPERQICLLFIFLSPTFWMLWLLLCVTTERPIAGYIHSIQHAHRTFDALKICTRQPMLSPLPTFSLIDYRCAAGWRSRLNIIVNTHCAMSVNIHLPVKWTNKFAIHRASIVIVIGRSRKICLFCLAV